MPDREQLIRQIAADESLLRRGLSATDVRWMIGALERLGYSVTPAESPGLPSESPQERPEGSEATHTAEPSIAELIGWQSVNGLDPESAWGTPSVDDMLDWLEAHGHSLDDVYDNRPIQPSPHVPDERYSMVLGDEIGGVYANTLHDLFSAAVRVAAGVETEETPT